MSEEVEMPINKRFTVVFLSGLLLPISGWMECSCFERL